MRRKKKSAEKPKIKVRDMKPKKDPKGGLLNEYLKLESTNTTLKISPIGSTSYKPQ